MNCDKALPLLSGLLDNEMSFEERERVESHLHECESCFALFLKIKEDSTRLEEAFAELRCGKEQFTTRTAALIAERERPHALSAQQPRAKRTTAHRVLLPALASAMASAAAFVLMGYLGDWRVQPGDHAVASRLAPSTAKAVSHAPHAGRDAEATSLLRRDSPGVGSAAPGETESQGGHGDAFRPVQRELPQPDGQDAILTGTNIQELIDELVAAVQKNDQSQVKGLEERLLSASSVSQKIVTELMSRFQSADDELVRETIAGILTSIRDDSLGDFFIRQMSAEMFLDGGGSVPVKRLLLYGLINNPAEGSETLLKDILQKPDEDPGVKVKAVDALGVLRSDAALEVLKTVPLQDKNEEVRVEALKVLASFAQLDPNLLKIYIDIIQSGTENFDVQQTALDEVGRVADPATYRATLSSLMGDGTPRAEIRARAKTLFNKVSSDHTDAESR